MYDSKLRYATVLVKQRPMKNVKIEKEKYMKLLKSSFSLNIFKRRDVLCKMMCHNHIPTRCASDLALYHDARGRINTKFSPSNIYM